MRTPCSDDLDFCDRALSEVSRTFAISIQGLPQELREAVRAAYLLCRIVDTIEDDRTIQPVARAALFTAFEDALRAAHAKRTSNAEAFELQAVASNLGEGAERTLCARSQTVFRTFAALPDLQRDAIVPRILEMSAGMRDYADRVGAFGALRIHDLADLERYCQYVAGTVGELLTDLFVSECRVEPNRKAQLDARASRFGIGLQLVNILKDVAEDADRGDCFLPQTCASEHRVDLERLLEPSERVRALSLCRSLCRRAREHLDAAEEYSLLWPHIGSGRDVRSFCAGPLALALGTLHRIEQGADTFVRRRAPAVSRDFVRGVFLQIATAMHSTQCENDHALRVLFERARVGLSGRPSRPPSPVVHSEPAYQPATFGTHLPEAINFDVGGSSPHGTGWGKA